MSDHFIYAVHLVLGIEGGYVNHLHDPGGETKYGITKRDFPHLDIAALTIEQAKEIYREEYWVPSGCGRLRDPKVAAKVFDMVCNMGRQRATRRLQRAINYLTPRHNELKVDGFLGPVTAEKTNHQDPELLVLTLRVYHAHWYVQLVEGPDLRFETFAKGWLIRAMS